MRSPKTLALFVCFSLIASACAPESEDDPELGVIDQSLVNVKMMVVGDSISHGLEGDFTWRYRLWEHLQANGVNAQLVGPWTGTHKLGPWQATSAPPSHSGAYRPGISSSFPKGNLAEWGWMMGEAKWVIAEHMRTYAPSVLLIELGFNDIAWNLSDTPADQIATGVLESLQQLVQNARTVNPSIKILVTDVPQRTPVDGYPELPAKITAYNNRIDGVIAGLTRASSPVHRVYFDLLFDQTRDAYDGLHPNVRGEYVIAKAFADELSKKFGIGGIMALPGSMPADLKPGPTGAITFKFNSDYSADMTWAHVFGAGGFYVSTRDLTNGETQFRRLPFPIGADGWHPTSLPAGHRIEYKLETSRGDYKSAYSPVSTLTTKALPAVTFSAAQTSSNAIEVRWNAVEGADDYHVYASSDCTGSSTSTSSASYQLVQWALAGKTSWKQIFINTRCMNYYVVASRNGGESPRPSTGYRVNMSDCWVDDAQIPRDFTNAATFAVRVRSSCTSDYGAIVQRLVGTRYTPASPVQITFVNRPFGRDYPGAALGNEVQVNYNWVQAHPNDRGMFLHELTHVVTGQFQGGGEPWLEGVADWVRYDMGEPAEGRGPAASCANDRGPMHWRDGYECTAAFLQWVGTTYRYPMVQQINELLHAGNFSAIGPTFTLVTNQTLDELWARCRQSTCAGGRAQF